MIKFYRLLIAIIAISIVLILSSCSIDDSNGHFTTHAKAIFQRNYYFNQFALADKQVTLGSLYASQLNPVAWKNRCSFNGVTAMSTSSRPQQDGFFIILLTTCLSNTSLKMQTVI